MVRSAMILQVRQHLGVQLQPSEIGRPRNLGARPQASRQIQKNRCRFAAVAGLFAIALLILSSSSAQVSGFNQTHQKLPINKASVPRIHPLLPVGPYDALQASPYTFDVTNS